MPEYLLGVNSGVGKHDGAAALLKDGQLVAMVEQERLSRRKQAWGEAAVEAIRRCLEIEQIDFEALAMVAYGWDEQLYAESHGAGFDEARFLRMILPREELRYSRLPPVRYVRHHLAHAWSALACSGFESAAILVLDARGELSATTLAYAEGTRVEILDEFGLHESLGNFYALAAEWCGLSFLGAGKLMGLAAYGQPTEPFTLGPTDRGYSFAGLGPPDPDPRRRYYHQQRSHLFESFRAAHPHAPGDGSNPMSYAAFASSVQRAMESAGLSLAAVLQARTGCRKLCLAGGVALNCSLNSRLAQSGLWDQVFVPPFASDAGVSVGAAMKVWHDLHPEGGGHRTVLQHAYWGRAFPEHELRQAIEEYAFPFVSLPEDELIAYVLDCLEQHRVVGWFQGRAEVGPRALGARSILGNPCRRDNLVRINALKGREEWRPLAPSVKAEDFSRFFDIPSPAEPLTDFMLVAARVQPEARPLIPAVVHVDGTARPHLVRRTVNSRLWHLIDGFGRRTGIPLLINTSLNGRDEPIVDRPQQALEILARRGLDVLVLGDHVVARPR